MSVVVCSIYYNYYIITLYFVTILIKEYNIKKFWGKKVLITSWIVLYYEIMRITNKKQNRIKTHIFTWKTLNGKTTNKREKNPLCQKLVEEMEELQQKHNYYYNPKTTHTDIYIYIYRVISKIGPYHHICRIKSFSFRTK